MVTSVSADQQPLPTVNRCGACTACCTVVPITELSKQAYQDCRYLTDGGCGKYRQRPDVCRRFECMYLSDHWDARPGGEMMRPDRCGLLVYGYRSSEGEPAIRVCEVIPGALATEIAGQLIPGFIEQGHPVAIHRDGCEPQVIRPRGDAGTMS